VCTLLSLDRLLKFFTLFSKAGSNVVGTVERALDERPCFG